MPLPDVQLRECMSAAGAFLEKRRPRPEIRDQLDFRADISESEVVIMEVRPAYNDKNRKIEHPVAKAKWIGTKKVWRLFWMRADLKWHTYEPGARLKTIGKVLDEVDRDPYGCFFG